MYIDADCIVLENIDKESTPHFVAFVLTIIADF